MVKEFFQSSSGTLSYVVYNENRDAVVIDSALDYDPVTMELSTNSLKPLLSFLSDNKLNVWWIIDTHVHADHVTGMDYLKTQFPSARTGIGERVSEVQLGGKHLFGLKSNAFPQGWPFDYLFKNGEMIPAGSLEFKVMATPGHTPSCVCYLFDDGLFVGDVIFMPEAGTGRCDFPGGDAEQLFDSIQKIFKLPDETKIFVGHNYPSGDKHYQFVSSVGVQKASNVHVKLPTSKESFVEFRKSRDKTLPLPKLFYASLFLNIRGGRLPNQNEQGQRLIQFPLFASF